MTDTPYTNEYLKFLKTLNKNKVDYLIIGAYATMIHTKEPRATKDMDTWIRQTEENVKKLSEALKEFTGEKIPTETIMRKNQKIEIKSETFKIEIWTSQEIMTFEQAWEKKKVESVTGFTINVISKEDLIKLKKHFNRPQDKMDLSLLDASKRK
ncbi:MAG: nucleotidyltransferase [Elusimicrobia bacterium]|nr:nucleotidyltransferase [Elusimicrobiota bacterium]